MSKKIIKFTSSPTGHFSLAYSEGDIAEQDDKQADALIEASFAVPATKEEIAAYKTQIAKENPGAAKAKAEKDAADKKSQDEADAKEKDEAAAKAKVAPASENAADKGAATAEKA